MFDHIDMKVATLYFMKKYVLIKIIIKYHNIIDQKQYTKQKQIKSVSPFSMLVKLKYD